MIILIKKFECVYSAIPIYIYNIRLLIIASNHRIRFLRLHSDCLTWILQATLEGRLDPRGPISEDPYDSRDTFNLC